MSRTLNALFLALCLPVLASGCPLERQAQVPQARAGDAAVAADPAVASDGYTQVSRSRDGIGKAYMGREIASVMGWQGAAWLEREEREREERGSVLLKELRLAAGMQVAAFCQCNHLIGQSAHFFCLRFGCLDPLLVKQCGDNIAQHSFTGA